MKKINIRLLVLPGLVLFIFLLLPIFAQADEEECGEKRVDIILRNDQGNFIPNLNYEIYIQTVDVDGNPKPMGKAVGKGKIDSNLGYGSSKFKEETSAQYALKVWDKNARVGEFWFYNEIFVGCGGAVNINLNISGIEFILRDADNNLVRNKDFFVYTQRYDADNKPIKEKKDLVAKLNTGQEGSAAIYVGDGSRSIDGLSRDFYIFEASSSGGNFILYDINVSDGKTTRIEYIFSDIKFYLKDSADIPFPANTKIEIYEQAYDADDKPVVGKKIKDVLTNDNGIALFEYPAGLYAARVMGQDKQYQYFWELEMEDRERKEYALTTGEEWRPGGETCSVDSNFRLTVRDLQGSYIPNIKFQIYEQREDIDGLPAPGPKVKDGTINNLGEGLIIFKPDQRKTYALKIYHLNQDVGEFWYFNAMKLECGQDVSIEKILPSMNVVLRSGDGQLKKNHKFSVYTQKFDVDRRPIKEKKDLVGALNTSEKGIATLYVSPDHPYNKEKRGLYVFTTDGENKSVFHEYDIAVSESQDVNFEYLLSDIILELKTPAGLLLADKTVDFYEQARNLKGEFSLGKKIASAKTDINGKVRFEYPHGYYGFLIKDDLGQDNVFWNVNIANRKRSNRTLTVNMARINGFNENGQPFTRGEKITVYSMIEDDQSNFYKDKKIKTIDIGANGFALVSLAPGPYLFTAAKSKIEYGAVLYAENGKQQDVTIRMNANTEVKDGQKYTLQKPVIAGPDSLAEKLMGHILLQVEENGEAWYVDFETKRRYYMKDGAVAYEMLRKFGLGITNENLNKIPIGLDDRLYEDWFDYDGDGLPDRLEEAIGTDPLNHDTDGDGYSDYEEVKNGFDPLRGGGPKLPWDTGFADRLKGRILLQVESRGEAWYVNPKDGKRYYMKNGDTAYQIMRFLSLGITNENLDKIEADSM